MSIIEILEKQGSITPAEPQTACKRSETTVWRYLNLSTNTGYVEKEGSTNKIIYKLKF